MGRLVYVTNGLRGGLNVAYELARRLEQAGHVIFFVGHRDLAKQVGNEGFSFTRLVADDHALTDLQAAIDDRGRFRALPRGIELRRAFARSTELVDTLVDLEPDGLLIDVEAHYAVIASQRLGLPTLLKSDWFSMTRRRGIPPLHSPQLLPTTMRERFAADAAWAKTLADRFVDNTARQLHPNRLMRRFAPFRYDTINRRDLRAVARAHDLRLRTLTTQTNWLRPHTYRDMRMITSTMSELDFGVESDPLVTSVGPLVPRNRIDANVPAETRDRWQEFRDRNRSSGRPLVYCSTGTMIDAPTVIDNVIAAARAAKDWDLLVGLGGRGSAPPAGTSSDHVLVLDYAPQAEILVDADAALLHGGINSINECVVHGVPMIVHQGGIGDQLGCAARVHHHGVGTRAPLAALTPSELGALVQKTLTDTTMAKRLRKAQADAEAYRSKAVLEEVTERLLAGQLADTRQSSPTPRALSLATKSSRDGRVFKPSVEDHPR